MSSLLSALPSALQTIAAALAADRRACTRRVPAFPLRVRVRYPQWNSCATASVRDSSANGIALLLTRRLREGALITLEPLTEPRPAASRSARVVYATPYGRGWLCGCQFTRPLSATDLRAWFGP